MQLLRPPASEELERAGGDVNAVPATTTWRVSKRCGATDISEICAPRANAMRRGDFRWDWKLGAWTDRARPLRQMTSRTKYFVYSERRDVAHVDHSGEPVQIWDCPWCGRALPSLAVESPMFGQGDGTE